MHGVQAYGNERRAVMSSGLPVLTYKTKKACGQSISGGAGGGHFTTAGTCLLISLCLLAIYGVIVQLILTYSVET